MTMDRNQKKKFFNVRRVLTRAVLGIAALLVISGTRISTGIVPPAQAQIMHEEADGSAQFHDALAPYGQWHHSSRWGDV